MSRSSRSQGVLARTVTVGHPNYCTFETVQNRFNSIRFMFYVAGADDKIFLDPLLL